MTAGRVAGRLIGATALALAALPVIIPVADSEPCPDIGVVFARGTAEPPGVGGVGQRFVDSLRAQLVPRTVGVHGVVYPASSNFNGGTAFTMNVVDGMRDEANHLRSVVGACPNIRMVLGGYSQGAVVTALATSGVVPTDVPSAAAPPPIPGDIASHVAAVVLFGMPAGWSATKYRAPVIDVGPSYAARSIELCAPGDTVCSGAPATGSSAAHQQYASNGMADQAASFAAGQLAHGAAVTQMAQAVP
ncbi:cutinase family protein [Mycolicibacterium vaccae]|uniref:cutinase family protein n=1 Tax=Mycolicibacterium vaccae TaxID=1810 RepID=UPI003D067C27